jgi:hypothetical protein
MERSALLSEVFAGILKDNVPTELFNWFDEKRELITNENSAAQLNLTFATVPRKTGRQPITVAEVQQDKLKQVHPAYQVNHWTIDRLARVWILLQVPSADKDNYFRKLEALFKTGEMNELVALYSALPGFYFPEEWQSRCATGIRSNIDTVLQALMYYNPYPVTYLAQPAWNQLVLKAFFTDKDVNRIIGLEERANRELASILIDYANERRSAHRAVNPQLWRLVANYIDESNIGSIEGALHSTDETEKKGAALACQLSQNIQAKQLLEKEPFLKSLVEEKGLTWATL